MTARQFGPLMFLASIIFSVGALLLFETATPASFALNRTPFAASLETCGGGKSLAGEVRATLQIVNKTSGTLQIFWLDYNGAPVAYGTLGAGQERIQPTWITHPWIAIDGTGECVSSTTVASASQDWVIGEAARAAPTIASIVTPAGSSHRRPGRCCRRKARSFDSTPARSSDRTASPALSGWPGA